jgi:type IV pilus assembly PilX-like protein
MTISNERGSALIITLMLLVILTAIGIYAISISTTEMSIALQSKTGTATLNSADSGAHYAIDLVPGEFPTWPPALPSDPRQRQTLADGSSYDWISKQTGNRTIKPGYGANYSFPDFQVDSIGKPPSQFVGPRMVQAVVNYGPVRIDTNYD